MVLEAALLSVHRHKKVFRCSSVFHLPVFPSPFENSRSNLVPLLPFFFFFFYKSITFYESLYFCSGAPILSYKIISCPIQKKRSFQEVQLHIRKLEAVGVWKEKQQTITLFFTSNVSEHCKVVRILACIILTL